jgi:predicted ribosome quality control (RQC) complex YloA/Tae2 family protein
LVFIERETKKAIRKLEHLKDDLDQANEGLMNKTFADLIYESGIGLHEKMTNLHVRDVNIILDAQKSLNENAQYFYKKYQKAKRTITHLNKQIDAQQSLILDLIDLQTYIEISKDDDSTELDEILHPYGYKAQKKPNKKKQTTPAIITIHLDHVTIYVGKNSLQNQYVTHTLGQHDDYWFHVKDAPGSHVVAKTNTLDEKTLRLCAMLAAYYSKMRESQSIPVDYTQIKYLKKIPKTPLHKVTYSKNKTIYIDINLDLIHTLISKKD